MHRIDTNTVTLTDLEVEMSAVYEDLLFAGNNHVEAGYALVSLYREQRFDISPEFLEYVTTGAMTMNPHGVPTIGEHMIALNRERARTARIAAPIDLGEVLTYSPKHRDRCGPKVVPHVDEPEARRPGLPVPMMERDYLPEVAFNR